MLICSPLSLTEHPAWSTHLFILILCLHLSHTFFQAPILVISSYATHPFRIGSRVPQVFTLVGTAFCPLTGCVYCSRYREGFEHFQNFVDASCDTTGLGPRRTG